MTATCGTTTATGNKTTGVTTTARGGMATGGTMTEKAAGQQGNRGYNDNNGRHDDAAR